MVILLTSFIQNSNSCFKVCKVKNNTNFNSNFCLMKSSGIVFIFLPLLYLIMWLKTSQKNFEKISIFEIWWLFFFKGVKTHFGKMPLKWCIFKNDFHKYCLLIGIVLNIYTLYCIWRILQQFVRTLTCKKGNICFHELMFYRPTD